MDTPQITPALLDRVALALIGADAVLGPTEDGGWWALALRDPAAAEVLRDIPVSTPDTHALTAAALLARRGGAATDRPVAGCRHRRRRGGGGPRLSERPVRRGGGRTRDCGVDPGAGRRRGGSPPGRGSSVAVRSVAVSAGTGRWFATAAAG